MRNPFIILTSLRGNRVRVNINHIITYSPRKFSDSNKYYTYMTNASPALLDTEFRETVEEIDEMIVRSCTKKQLSSMITACAN